MALARADTARTMLSRKNSTSVLDRGLSHVFKDLMNQPLPDSLEKLQEFCMKHHETSFVSIQNIKWWSFMNHMVYGCLPYLVAVPVVQELDAELADLAAMESTARGHSFFLLLSLALEKWIYKCSSCLVHIHIRNKMNSFVKHVLNFWL